MRENNRVLSELGEQKRDVCIVFDADRIETRKELETKRTIQTLVDRTGRLSKKL